LREICPCKKRNPKSGANIGAITGILLKRCVMNIIIFHRPYAPVINYLLCLQIHPELAIPIVMVMG
jgi:hypothetical protein